MSFITEKLKEFQVASTNWLFWVIALVVLIGYTLTFYLYFISPPPPPLDPASLAYKRQFIRDLTRRTWNLYATSQKLSIQDPVDHELTRDREAILITESLSTLWIMNLETEFEMATKWVIQSPANDITLKKDYNIGSILSANYLGSFLSSYALTGDRLFLNQAVKLGNILKKALENGAGPTDFIRPFYCHKNGEFSSYDICDLSDIASYDLEFRYLTELTADEHFQAIANNLTSYIQTGLMANGLHSEALTGFSKKEWKSYTCGLSTKTIPFYISLLNRYIQSNGTDVKAIKVYLQAMDAIERFKFIGQTAEGFTTVKNRPVMANEMTAPKLPSRWWIEGADCATSAMLTFGAQILKQNAMKNNCSLHEADRQRIEKHQRWAVKITEFCYFIANRSIFGMFPDSEVRNIEPTDEIDLKSVDRVNRNSYAFYYYLSRNIRPELAQSYFYLWRTTHDQKYRDWAWEMTLHVNRSRTPGIVADDLGPKNFLGSTLKYLYLTFTEDDVLPLDKWAFNRVGQPLPVKGMKVRPKPSWMLRCFVISAIVMMQVGAIALVILWMIHKM